MNTDLKKNINLLSPVVITATAGYVLYSKGKDYKFILALMAIIFIISWLLTSQVTKMIEQAQERPDHVNVDPDAAGTIDQNFKPEPYTDRLKKDIYSGVFVSRDSSIYEDLVKLSNANLLKVSNDWNDRYFNLDNETMITAMEGETYGNNLVNNVAANASAIISRLKGMGAN